MVNNNVTVMSSVQVREMDSTNCRDMWFMVSAHVSTVMVNSHVFVVAWQVEEFDDNSVASQAQRRVAFDVMSASFSMRDAAEFNTEVSEEDMAAVEAWVNSQVNQ